ISVRILFSQRACWSNVSLTSRRNGASTMRYAPVHEVVALPIEHRDAWTGAHLAHEIEELGRLVRVTLLRGGKPDRCSLHERRERADLAEQAMLRVVLPPERLRGRLDPRKHALVAHAPRGEQLDAEREELVRHPQIDV